MHNGSRKTHPLQYYTPQYTPSFNLCRCFFLPKLRSLESITDNKPSTENYLKIKLKFRGLPSVDREGDSFKGFYFIHFGRLSVTCSIRAVVIYEIPQTTKPAKINVQWYFVFRSKVILLQNYDNPRRLNKGLKGLYHRDFARVWPKPC